MANPIKYGATLTFEARMNSSGIYECVAENGIGKAANAKAFVQILRKYFSFSLLG
jgi:hypothetical protein